MLKGKSVIELTDVRTNTKEIYEDENLITNAVPDLLRLNPSGLMYPIFKTNAEEYKEEIFPIANKCYGGILLFEAPLDKVGRFKYQGLVLGKYKEEITTEFKDKEEGNAQR